VKIIYWLGRGEGSTSDEAVGDHAGLLIGTTTPAGETYLGLQHCQQLHHQWLQIVCNRTKVFTFIVGEWIFSHAGVVVA
jgi:hypothetical protein